MTGPDLDALIRDVEFLIKIEDCVSSLMAEALVSELKTYRAMALRLERCVHDLIKEAESCRP